MSDGMTEQFWKDHDNIIKRNEKMEVLREEIKEVVMEMLGINEMIDLLVEKIGDNFYGKDNES